MSIGRASSSYPKLRLGKVVGYCVVLLAGCGPLGGSSVFSPAPDGYQSNGGAGGNANGGAGGAGAGAGAGSTQGDLPCEVAAVLAEHCDSCHAVNIPPLLRTRAELMAPSTSDASRSFAEVSVERMQDAASPMPPTGVPPSEDAQVMADWIADGFPEGDCGSGGAGGGGYMPDYNTPVMCSSGKTWNNGSDGGKQMYPGQACNDCHQDEKPDEIYTFAGTVYPTAHEPDNCLGVGAGDAIVEFTDANLRVTTATTNSSGNFTVNGSFAYPVTVRILANDLVLPMGTPLQPGDGDCNTCHDQDGNSDAPGRIIMPQ